MGSIAGLLFRRRQVWLPTVWGWTALIAVAGGIGFATLPHAYRWLAVDEAARGPDGRGARLLVVEGWLNPYELDEAARRFRDGHYGRIVTTGGPSFDWPEAPLPTTFAERAAGYLERHGIPGDRVTAVPAPETAVDRTYVSAVQVRDWLRRSGTPVPALDVFTGGAHARRSRVLYRMAFGPDVEIGALSAHPMTGDPDRWWTHSATVKLVVAESLSTAWTFCCFWPPHS